MIIRKETPDDVDAIYGLNVEAFETKSEAELVNSLRALGEATISLVAENSGEVVGHILFSKVTLSGGSNLNCIGLAPMVVMPKYQNMGIGSALVEAGLIECKAMGFEAVVVLGHPNFYPRFGFRPSSEFGIKSEYEVPDEFFMAIELRKSALSGMDGIISYHAAFAGR